MSKTQNSPATLGSGQGSLFGDFGINDQVQDTKKPTNTQAKSVNYQYTITDKEQPKQSTIIIEDKPKILDIKRGVDYAAGIEGLVKVDGVPTKKEIAEPTLPTYGISHLDYYIDHIAESLNCPRDYVTCSVMTAIATAGGTNYTSDDGVFKNNPMFYMAIVGHQSANKSAPISQALEPINDINTELYHAYREEKKNAPKEEDKQPKVIRKQIIVQDITSEALEIVMTENERGVCLVSDELATKFGSIDKYRQGSGIASELTLFSNKPLSTNRISRESLFIERSYLTQIGGIQPSRLSEFYGSREWIGSGYNARWLFCYPSRERYKRKKRVPLDMVILADYSKHIRNIYNNADEKGGVVNFSDEALALLDDYRHEQSLKSDATEIDYEMGIYEKLTINVQRWALATHISKRMAGNAQGFISADTVRYAIDCMRYFEFMALKVKNQIESERSNTKEAKLTSATAVKTLAEIYPQLNKSKLAESLGVSQPYISKLINNK